MKYGTKIEALEEFRENSINGLTSRQLKFKLNKLSKEDDYYLFLRKILETEDVNISAKKYTRQYRERYYSLKSDLLNFLINLIKSSEHELLKNLNYGIGIDKLGHLSKVIYFDLSVTGLQVSFHFDSLINEKQISNYNKFWDGKKDVTMKRILKEIELCLENSCNKLL